MSCGEVTVKSGGRMLKYSCQRFSMQESNLYVDRHPLIRQHQWGWPRRRGGRISRWGVVASGLVLGCEAFQAVAESREEIPRRSNSADDQRSAWFHQEKVRSGRRRALG